MSTIAAIILAIFAGVLAVKLCIGPIGVFLISSVVVVVTKFAVDKIKSDEDKG